jgi:RHS repeat-associated protein
VRTDSAAGASTYYYQRWIAGAHRVVEIVGECACSGNDRSYAYDSTGNLVLEQDGRGYITRHEYLGDGRKSLDEIGLRPAWCDPEDFPEDPAACRLTIDELEALGAADVVATDAHQIMWYAYDDPNWPDRPTQICRSSVLQLEGQNDRVACSSTTYDPLTGQWTSSTESGWTGQSAAEAVLESRTTARTFYGGSFTLPAFDPGGAFDPAWMAVAQPENLVRSIDGPRTDVADVVRFVYYPVADVLGAPVPEDWRGYLAAQMDPLGNVTRYEDYDQWGNARRIVGPTGITTEMTFDNLGHVLTRTLVGGEGCDPADDPLCTTDLVTTSTYGPGGGPIESVTLPSGTVTEYAYDSLGRILTTDRGPAAGMMLERMESEYDPVTGLRIRDSRLGYESGPGWVEHSRTEYQHYLTGQLVMVQRPRFEDDPAPSEEHHSYDVAGRVATVQDPNHTAPNVEYVYDPLGRLALVRQLLDPEAPPTGQWSETTYGYDSNGNLVAVTDANGNLTEYLVDDFGQTVRIISPVTGATEMAYDEGGNLVTRIDARGVTATSVYDTDGRLTGITYDDGVTSEEFSFFYDAAGRRTRAETPEVTQAFTHSRRGLVLTASQELVGAIHETSYTYDLDGQIESVIYPSGRAVSFARDFAGRPTAIHSVAPGAGAPVTIADYLVYLPFGPASHLELGPLAGRLTETRKHDWHYRRTAQQLADALPTMLLDLEYGYDAAGNLTGLTDNLGDRSAGYNYDDLGRLTSVTWVDANRVFDYDAVGNLARIGVDEGLAGEGEVLLGYLENSVGENSPVLASTETSQGGAPLSSYSVVSDDVGNVTSDGLTTLDYNLENHLIDRDLKGVTLDYTYTADGRLARSERSDTGVATDIVLDVAGRRLAKLEGSAWRDYVYLGDQLLAYFDDGAAVPVQVVSDHIGMPMIAVDGSGAVVWQAKAEPYGELRGEVGLAADPGLRYPGQWQDELDLEADCVDDTCNVPGPLDDSYSLLENGYRWYKPAWGRYGQSDPIGEIGDRLLSGELYAYAKGNPRNFLDPSGLTASTAGFAGRCIVVEYESPVCEIQCWTLYQRMYVDCVAVRAMARVGAEAEYYICRGLCMRLPNKPIPYKTLCDQGCSKAKKKTLEKVEKYYKKCIKDAQIAYEECLRNEQCTEELRF